MPEITDPEDHLIREGAMSAWSGQSRWSGGMVALLGLLVACHPPRGATSGVRPTPGAPPGFATVLDTATKQPSAQPLRDYVAKLDFDTNYEAGDKQRLAVGSYPDLHYGPLVAIQPEVGNHTITEADLHQGRIIARIVNYSDSAYPKLGLAPKSTTYWWAQLGADSSTNRSIMISTDAKAEIVSRIGLPLIYDADRTTVTRIRAVARWLWSDSDEQGWSSCGVKCCRN